MHPTPFRLARHVAATAAVLIAAVVAPAAPALAASPVTTTPDSLSTTDLARDADLVDALNARYADTAMSCEGGEAAYFCNGVVVRTTSSTLPTPLQIDRDGASFSYLREDLGIETLWPAASAGMLLQAWGDQETPMRLRCAFPTDAATNTRPDSCDRSTDEVAQGNPEGSSAPCAVQGIDSAESWSRHFDALVWKNGTCAFDTDRDAFAASLEMREFLPAETLLDRMWNEVVVGAWSAETTPQLPIEAFFFVQGKSGGLEAAEALQDEFEALSGRVVPIVGIDFSREAPFIPVPSTDLSVSAPAALVGNARPAFAGRATPGASIAVLDAAWSTVCEAEVTARGRWTCTPDADFAPGVHDVTIRETSSGGDVVTIGHSFEYRVNAAPQIISPAAGERLESGPVVVTGTAEPLLLIEIRDGERFLCLTLSGPDGSFSCTVDEVEDGAYRWTATADAGVVTSPATVFEFVVGPEDAVDPVTPITPVDPPVAPGEGAVQPVVAADAASAASGLASTGVEAAAGAAAAGLLLAAGVGAVLLRRRRAIAVSSDD